MSDCLNSGQCKNDSNESFPVVLEDSAQRLQIMQSLIEVEQAEQTKARNY
jgi:hypothetical protein